MFKHMFSCFATAIQRGYETNLCFQTSREIQRWKQARDENNHKPVTFCIYTAVS